MKRLVRLSILALLSFPFLLSAQIPQASLFEHLCTVNQEWPKQQDIQIEGTQILQFKNEAERIQTHLLLVEKTLRARSTEHLTSAQKQNRLQRLDELHQYAEAGRFPTNHYHSQRIPYFIDNYGVACAVGHLLIESGEGEFAQQIREERNNAYIGEMPYPELLNWADGNGFTTDELAWIQPGYPPPTTWNTFGGAGIDGPVYTSYDDAQTNKLILGGNFQQAPGTSCQGIVTWDGMFFEPMGSLGGDVHAIIRYNGELYAAGAFPLPQAQMHNFAHWNGTEWTTYAVGGNGIIYDLCEFNGELYAAGDLAESTGHVRKISSTSMWTGELVGIGMNAPVHDLEVFEGKLVAGGEFTMADNQQAMMVAAWDGSSWSQLGNGLDNVVRSLEADGVKLYAGGDFYNDAEEKTFGLARYDANNDWNNLIDVEHYASMGSSALEAPFRINKVKKLDNKIMLGGRFTIFPLVGLYGASVGYYDDFAGGIIADAMISGEVHDVAMRGSVTMVMGDFDDINFGTPASNIIANNVISGIGEHEIPQLALGPNPLLNQGTILLEQVLPQVEFRLYNTEGKRVQASYEVTGKQIHVNRSELPAGIYVAEVWNGSQLIGAGKWMLSE